MTIYDAPLIAESITPQMRENLDDELTEVKSENAIDRITSQANPRTPSSVFPRAWFPHPHRHGRALRRGQGAGRAPVRGAPFARRRRPRRRRLARQRADRLRQSAARVANRDFYAKGAAEQELAAGADISALQAAASADDFAGRLS